MSSPKRIGSELLDALSVHEEMAPECPTRCGNCTLYDISDVGWYCWQCRIDHIPGPQKKARKGLRPGEALSWPEGSPE